MTQTREQITLEEAQDRRLRGFIRSRDLATMALLFDDDAFTVLRACVWYEDDPRLEEDRLNVRQLLCEFDDNELRDHRLLSEDEIVMFYAQEKIQNDAIVEQHERATYERLKAKFEGEK
jgi:hypothetical protein